MLLTTELYAYLFHRKLEDGPIPSEAKRPMDAALHSLSKISVTDSTSATINPLPEGKSTPVKVIRLRRPEIPSDTPGTPGRLQSGKTSVSLTTHTKVIYSSVPYS